MKYLKTLLFFLTLIPNFILAQGIETTKVAENLYMVGDRTYSLFYITDTGVIVIDPLDSIHANATMNAIKSVTDKPVTHLFYSHNHWDHISGGEIFKNQGASIISHKEAKNNIPANPNVLFPDETWDGNEKEFTIGNKTLELFYFGRNHGNGMTVFRIPEHDAIFIVDLVVPDRVLYAYLPDASPKNWVESLKEIQSLDFDLVLMSHVRALGSREDITLAQNYFDDLYAAVQEQLDLGTNLFEIPSKVQLPKYKQWKNYDEWLHMNVWRILMEKSIGQ